jgi:hypothetical protein
VLITLKRWVRSIIFPGNISVCSIIITCNTSFAYLLLKRFLLRESNIDILFDIFFYFSTFKQINDNNKMYHVSSIYNKYNKRVKLRHEADRVFIEPLAETPQEGFWYYDLDNPEGGEDDPFYDERILFDEGDPSEWEPFNPKVQPKNEIETYKAGLIVDKVTNIKRLKDPARWCILPIGDTVEVEVPLTKLGQYDYWPAVTQELGHVAWLSVTIHGDKEIYEERLPDIETKQVLTKWSKPTGRYGTQPRLFWDSEYKADIEVPHTVFCTEKWIIDKVWYRNSKDPNRTYWRGWPKIEIVHHTAIAHTERDNIGCSIFRRVQPPSWTFWSPAPEESREDKEWNGLENRLFWIYQSLYTIWAGEADHPRWENYRERVYWCGPKRQHNVDEYFQHVHPCRSAKCWIIEEVPSNLPREESLEQVLADLEEPEVQEEEEEEE